jgi:hypothetical protein
MKALIDPRFNRVAEVAEQAFPVAPPLFWVNCADEVKPDRYEWNGTTCVPKETSA